jgi:hypothetical protein
MESPPDIPEKRSSNVQTTGPRWMKVLLFFSLAANLAVIGVGVGIVLHDQAGGPRGSVMRDPSFGAFDQALTRADRMALRREFIRQSGPLVQSRAATKAILTDLLAALRADPFDPENLENVMHVLNQNGQHRLELGQKLLSERFLTMSAEDRSKFADRLEEIISRSRSGSGGPTPEN